MWSDCCVIYQSRNITQWGQGGHTATETNQMPQWGNTVQITPVQLIWACPSERQREREMSHRFPGLISRSWASVIIFFNILGSRWAAFSGGTPVSACCSIMAKMDSLHADRCNKLGRQEYYIWYTERFLSENCVSMNRMTWPYELMQQCVFCLLWKVWHNFPPAVFGKSRQFRLIVWSE